MKEILGNSPLGYGKVGHSRYDLDPSNVVECPPGEVTIPNHLSPFLHRMHLLKCSWFPFDLCPNGPPGMPMTKYGGRLGIPAGAATGGGPNIDSETSVEIRDIVRKDDGWVEGQGGD